MAIPVDKGLRQPARLSETYRRLIGDLSETIGDYRRQPLQGYSALSTPRQPPLPPASCDKQGCLVVKVGDKEESVSGEVTCYNYQVVARRLFNLGGFGP